MFNLRHYSRTFKTKIQISRGSPEYQPPPPSSPPRPSSPARREWGCKVQFRLASRSGWCMCTLQGQRDDGDHATAAFSGSPEVIPIASRRVVGRRCVPSCTLFLDTCYSIVGWNQCTTAELEYFHPKFEISKQSKAELTIFVNKPQISFDISVINDARWSRPSDRRKTLYKQTTVHDEGSLFVPQ